jgi:anti-anti-sigma regulatory factor
VRALPSTSATSGFGNNKRENQIILEFSGAATPVLNRELERLAAQCRGDVGIDLSDVSGLSPSLVPILERIRKRLTTQQHGFFLCNPSSKPSTS